MQGPSLRSEPAGIHLQPGLKQILVVDDIPEIGDLFRFIHRRIRTVPTQLTVEVNSARALELARRERFDVIVTDYRMREVDGIELLLASRAHHPTGRRVLMTGYNEIPTTMERIQSASIDAYVQKPLRSQDILMLLIDMLQGDPTTLDTYRARAREIETLGAEDAALRSGRHSAAAG